VGIEAGRHGFAERSIRTNCICATHKVCAGTGATTIERGLADAVAFGRMLIAHPDLPARIRTFNMFDRSTSYGGDAQGYADGPSLHAAADNDA
jgi:2,4-dienoyl-CoA reductase-like NADH-dependent reductase (Old Yellow Enzyme family)